MADCDVSQSFTCSDWIAGSKCWSLIFSLDSGDSCRAGTLYAGIPEAGEYSRGAGTARERDDGSAGVDTGDERGEVGVGGGSDYGWGVRGDFVSWLLDLVSDGSVSPYEHDCRIDSFVGVLWLRALLSGTERDYRDRNHRWAAGLDLLFDGEPARADYHSRAGRFAGDVFVPDGEGLDAGVTRKKQRWERTGCLTFPPITFYTFLRLDFPV